MSSGLTHHTIWRKNAKWAIVLSLLVYAIADPFSGYNCFNFGCISINSFITTGVLLGYGLGRYVDPDLDQVSITSAEGRMINELPIIGYFLYAYWSFYGAIFRKHHRSFWTHFPIISTLIRIFYLFFPLIVIFYLKEWNSPFLFQSVVGMWIGLSLADFFHWWEDGAKNTHRTLRKRS